MKQRAAEVYRLLRCAGWWLPLWGNAAEPAPGGYQLPPLTVPAGFTVELAAAPPLVGYPMMACFDERGRLFIAEGAGFNLDEKQLAERRPNFIRMLEDTDGDGRFDTSTIFADRLMIPNGVLWHQGALYVAEPPGIWRYTDANGDGVADQREHIAGNVRSNGMSSTLHGPILHPTGRLFWCSGQSGYSLDKDREPPPGRIAPGVFSLRVDGSEHEVFAVGGMANPVEVTFNDEGEVFGLRRQFQVMAQRGGGHRPVAGGTQRQPVLAPGLGWRAGLRDRLRVQLRGLQLVRFLAAAAIGLAQVEGQQSRVFAR
jgi:glucose/arabinose dehydrogenase